MAAVPVACADDDVARTRGEGPAGDEVAGGVVFVGERSVGGDLVDVVVGEGPFPGRRPVPDRVVGEDRFRRSIDGDADETVQPVVTEPDRTGGGSVARRVVDAGQFGETSAGMVGVGESDQLPGGVMGESETTPLG